MTSIVRVVRVNVVPVDRIGLPAERAPGAFEITDRHDVGHGAVLLQAVGVHDGKQIA